MAKQTFNYIFLDFKDKPKLGQRYIYDNVEAIICRTHRCQMDASSFETSAMRWCIKNNPSNNEHNSYTKLYKTLFEAYKNCDKIFLWVSFHWKRSCMSYNAL